MDNKLSALWVEKYRPSSISEYIFQDKTHEVSFSNMISKKSIPHLLLTGNAGTGKTTMSKLLVSELELDCTDVLLINASDENSVDTIRDKIKSFISTFAMGSFKVVQLEESDYLSPSAQGILRQLMEEYADSARFILTANYEHKLIPAIKSRCQHFRFKGFDVNDVAERIVTILASEKIKFDLDLIDKYVTSGFPDVRKIINMLQQNSTSGVLTKPTTQHDSDYHFKLIELMEHDDWYNIRKLLCSNVPTEEWDDVYRFMYSNLDKVPKFENKDKWEAGIVIIADHVYKHALCADPEINAAAMFIRLSQI